MPDLSFFSRLPEALDWYVEHRFSEGDWGISDLPKPVADLAAAARLVVDLLTVCPTCDGSGKWFDQRNTAIGYPCPSCGRRGVVLSEQAVERAARALAIQRNNADGAWQYWIPEARAALWAVLDGEDVT